MGRPKKLREGEAVLTFENIAETATKIADTEGITKVSMRRLATELDCGVMSLYHYISDKEALIEALVDQVASEVQLPGSGQGWRATAQQISESTLEAQLEHPWVVPIWSSTWPGPHRQRRMECLLEALANSGLSAELADLGFHALINHIQGFALQQVAFEQLASRASETEVRVQEMLADHALPYVHAHMHFHRSGRETPDEFRFTLDLILDGLEKHIAD